MFMVNQKKDLGGFTGVIMGIQVPLMIIHRRGVSVMSGVLLNRGVIHLRYR
jgi:hypothetical protein